MVHDISINIMPSIKRRRGQSLHLELPNGHSEELPQVAALFLIVFDVKTGYALCLLQRRSRLRGTRIDTLYHGSNQSLVVCDFTESRTVDGSAKSNHSGHLR